MYMLSLIAVSALALAAPASDCLSYSDQATVAGVLSLAPRPGSQHDNAVTPDHREDFFFVLVPGTPVCVNAGNNADGLEPEIKALNVELGVTDASTFRLLRTLVGHSVVCNGSIASPARYSPFAFIRSPALVATVHGHLMICSGAAASGRLVQMVALGIAHHPT